jgi:hypothetical protein
MKESCRRAFLLFFVCLPGAQLSRSQDIEESGIREREAAVKFCQELQTAVRANDKARVAEWIMGYPIEVQRGAKNILVADDMDFVQKFDLIFDADITESLFAATACELPPYPNGSAKIAEGKIDIDQVGEELKTVILRISPPQDVDSVFQEREEYDTGAAEFFKKLQKALSADDRQAVANMCYYPLSVDVGSNPRRVHNRAELIAQYPKVFTPEVRRAVLALAVPIHMGWRGFMTDRGELWLDLVVGTHVFRVGTVNGRYIPATKHSKRQKPPSK